MDMKYSFSSGIEPTDAQLETLMKEVAEDARIRREKADQTFWQSLKEEVRQAEIRSCSLKTKKQG